MRFGRGPETNAIDIAVVSERIDPGIKRRVNWIWPLRLYSALLDKQPNPWTRHRRAGFGGGAMGICAGFASDPCAVFFPGGALPDGIERSERFRIEGRSFFTLVRFQTRNAWAKANSLISTRMQALRIAQPFMAGCPQPKSIESHQGRKNDAFLQ